MISGTRGRQRVVVVVLYGFFSLFMVCYVGTRRSRYQESERYIYKTIRNQQRPKTDARCLLPASLLVSMQPVSMIITFLSSAALQQST